MNQACCSSWEMYAWKMSAVVGSAESTSSWQPRIEATVVSIALTMWSMASWVLISPLGNSGSAGCSAITAGRPSGEACRALILSAISSLPARAMSVTSSRLRWRSRKFVPTMFQWACLAVRLRAMKSTSTVWRFLLRASEAMKPCSAFSLAVFSEPCGSGTVTDCVIELAPFSSKMKDVFTIARGRDTRNPRPLSVRVCLITVDGVDASAQTLGVSEVPDVDITVETRPQSAGDDAHGRTQPRDVEIVVQPGIGAVDRLSHEVRVDDDEAAGEDAHDQDGIEAGHADDEREHGGQIVVEDDLSQPLLDRAVPQTVDRDQPPDHERDGDDADRDESQRRQVMGHLPDGAVEDAEGTGRGRCGHGA